ncbi:GTPase-activating protein and VPS9 domain-containing protein 1-like isoform X4 [Anneissia japonica]|uniref:GTPase-activating protein and VPS9 domain-containing protein 1-like isoform X4 n=1 Tax=Anneissia japonica TaxID=1529436 RepID=UPI001425B8B2|nr:GTPase-activating protein and VPS9 domain-containing protein 1-like isoform X4 [Anneissia japonica]
MMNLDLLELARHLKQERLYVSSEKHLLQKLHEEVTQLADKLYRVSWIARHQRQTLNSLILANVDSPPAACCHRANALEEVGFVDGYKKLGFQDTVYGEFLCCLKDNPKIVGMCLAQGEREYPTGIQCLVHNLMSSVYGNAVIQEDERRVLQLLQSLMEFELASSDDPRRLLRRGSCAFSHAMRLFTEGLFSGKLYLTAALHEPVMALLMENDTYFETDTRKMLDHLSNEEHLKLFGPKNSPTYTTKLQEYIDRVGHQLVALCNKFISSLKNSMFCFPQSLDWLISQFYKILIRSGKVDQTEVRAMCGDLLLTCFICPAIVNPEPYGVASDILISEVARFNLVQVAQILQSLSLMREDTQVKSGDILSQFAKGCMSSYLDTVIDSHSTNANPAINNNQLQGMTRSVALICESELHNLVAYFRSSLTANQGNPELKDLEVALSVLPNPANLSAPSISTSSGNTPGTTPPGTPGSISRKGSKAIKVAKKRLQEDQESESSSPPSDTCMVTQPEDVLVISLGNHPNECPGMLSESKVLSSLPTKSKSQSEDKRANLGSINEHPEKQLRFSAEASVTNDHLMEAMSIGASNSVYSIDYDNENTSNISGRNTPRSAISLASSTTDNPRPDLIDSTQLPNNANITDRFGKFEIGDELENKKMHGLSGETFSDTWSTDVIESDNSEPSEANPTERLQEISESDLEYSALGAVARLPESIMEISETTSETWSVDVLQSDSEALDDRLIEVADAPEVTGLQLLEEESEQMSSKASEGQSSRRSSYGSQSIGRSSNNDSPSGEDNPKKDQENGSDKGKPWWKHLIGSRKPKNRTTKEEAKDLGEKRKKSSSTEGIQITGISNHGLQDVYSQDDGNIGMMSSSVPDTTSEDILDKYRGLGKTQSHDHLADVDEADNLLSFGMVQDRQQSMSDQDGQSIDSDLESSYSFQDAKRKLRIVLCAADFHTLPWLTNFSHRHRARSIIGSIIQKDISSYPENELIAFLKVQLAEAINLQNKSLIAQLHETLRCVASFDDDTSKRLVASLTEDYENRSPYICYLVLSRKGLIASKSHLERLLERVERDKYVSNKYFTSVCVRLFLGRQEEAIHKFISDFKRLTVSDEKTDLVEHFLSCLKNWIQQDAIWQSASEIQKLDAEVATERAIMGRIYQLALYPNAEGDIHRDQVLFEHIQRLSKVVTASHRSLQIPEKYRRESPWPAAQAEILNINVYKTPKDKLQCVLRCCSIIMNLLNMASDNSVPGADDFVPVMVFVLIKANPPSLLSTVQYVNSFYDNRLSGEEMYWWMQFSAAIEFIKTIDDRK